MASISTTTSAAVQATTPRAWLVPGAMIAGIGGPLVLAVCNTLVNFTPDWRRAESTADGVNATIAHPVLAEFIIGTGIVAVLLIVPGIWAVAARLAPRTPVLAAIGGWMMATGYICALVLSTSSLTEQKIALSGLDPESFGKAFDAQWPMGQIMIGAIFGFGALCGGIVLGIAILRQLGGVAAPGRRTRADGRPWVGHPGRPAVGVAPDPGRLRRSALRLAGRRHRRSRTGMTRRFGPASCRRTNEHRCARQCATRGRRARGVALGVAVLVRLNSAAGGADRPSASLTRRRRRPETSRPVYAVWVADAVAVPIAIVGARSSAG